jgi:hypothetical protein
MYAPGQTGLSEESCGEFVLKIEMIFFVGCAAIEKRYSRGYSPN